MRTFTASVAAVALVVLAACAPTVLRFDPAEGARAFTVTIDGVSAQQTGGSFAFRSDVYDIDVTLGQRWVTVEMVNNSPQTIRVNPDRSAYVLADGSSSAVVTGTVSWITRNDPQGAIVIPRDAKASEMLIPRSNLGFSSISGLYVDNMFEWPLTSRVTIRLVLSVEVEADESEVEIVFVGSP
jgi:hypothetical protein